MTLHRYAARRDDNEAEIVAALESCGFHVERISEPGVPDLLLSRAGRWHLAEVKTEHGRLSKSQNAFRARARAPVPVFREIDDVLAWVKDLP